MKHNHYYKWCEWDTPIDIPDKYTGDAIIECRNCGYGHPRQILNGEAVSCNSPRTNKPLMLKETK